MSIFTKVLGWFTGGGKTVEKVTELADEAFHTEQEKASEDAKDLSDARGMKMFTHGTIIDVVVDATNRMIRPGVTILVLGGLFGYWVLPNENEVPPFWQNIAVLVITFWFGGRALLKDLPTAIALMRQK